MNLKRNLKSIFTVTAVLTILAAGNPALVAEDASSPAPVVCARITALTGKLLNGAGDALIVGSELKVGDIVKTAAGEPVRLVIGQAGTSSSIICIQPKRLGLRKLQIGAGILILPFCPRHRSSVKMTFVPLKRL